MRYVVDVTDRRSPLDGSPPAWPPLLAARGTLAQSSPHAHHGMHVVLAIDGEIASRLEGEPSFTASAGIVTAPDQRHEIKSDACEVLLVFIDPESGIGAALRRGLRGAARRISAEERRAIELQIDPRTIMDRGGVAWTDALLGALGLEPSPHRAALHPAVLQVLALARDADPDQPPSLRELAASVQLSEGRLMHAFTESVGIPLRPYLAWLRVQRAVVAIATGAALTQAAHEAGFSDAAHMSRTFRKMLGLTPSEIADAIVASPFKTAGAR